ncbi:hypothetical protein Lalb_Chr21g0305131 [Lupinus albus]|uniref:Uncharacterized protein n=1 Tax=Lupinus albus TaxID=3870 RepID=A0A6A4NR61_LUPAL|nr:hypothetical protein Lalb_Chr21g0305131 [Lupinus albus]
MSMQRYVFDGEARKKRLEPKNLVDCTSVLLEQKLAKACLADKDAEALRCQKLLMEEDAAQRRQTQILEKKHKKKLKRKEKKAKERLKAPNPDTIVNHAPSPHVTVHCPESTEVVDGDPQWRNDSDTYQNFEQQRSQGHNRQHMIVSRGHRLPKSQSAVANDLLASQNSQNSKLEVIQKRGPLHEGKAPPILKGSKVWRRKPKPEIGRVMSEARLQKEPQQGKNHKVLIGSIWIPLGNCGQSEGNPVASHAECMIENLAKKNSAQEKRMKTDSFKSGNTVKLWRPVSQHRTKDPLPLQSGGTEADAVYGKDDQTLSGQSNLRSFNIDSDIDSKIKLSGLGAKVDPGKFRISSHAAKAFLAQRWKEAISSNHVKLVLSLDSEPPGRKEVQDYELATCRSSDADRCSSLASAENLLPATAGVTKSKHKMKSGKGIKMKYIPKQKAAT